MNITRRWLIRLVTGIFVPTLPVSKKQDNIVDPNIQAYRNGARDPDILHYNRKFSPTEQSHVNELIGSYLSEAQLATKMHFKPFGMLVTFAGTKLHAELISAGRLGEVTLKLGPWDDSGGTWG